jgi:hypothetical protein
MRNLLFTLTVLLMTTLTVGAGADPRGGRKTFSDTIGRGMRHTYDLVLNGDETTIVEINGNGRSDLDCFIFDENDNLVVKDDDSSDQCRLTVTPLWTGHFTLIIKNVGTTHSTYRGVAY